MWKKNARFARYKHVICRRVNQSMEYELGKAITLREHISQCLKDEQSSEWMVFKERKYSLDMMVYPVYLDDWDLDDEEYIKLEEKVLSENLAGNLLNTDQLVDIANNLGYQSESYTEKQLEKAINYYSKNDAFIQL